MADRGWQREFDDPILLPDGTQLGTLREAISYLAKTVPKVEQNMPQVLTATSAMREMAFAAHCLDRR
jgi:hypothetical protein